MNYKLLPLFVLLIMSFSGQAQSQDNPEKVWNRKNSLIVTAGSVGLYGAASLNFERLIYQRPKGILSSLWVKAGYGGFYGMYSYGPLSVLGITSLTGRGRHHFEFAMGVSRLVDNNDDISNETMILPMGTIGYRNQSPSKPLMFRVGFSFPETVYLSFGVSF